MLRLACATRRCAMPSAALRPAAICVRHIATCAMRCAVFRNKTPVNPDVLPIVELRVDRKLMAAVTDEIVEEAAAAKKSKKQGSKKRATSTAAASTSDATAATAAASAAGGAAAAAAAASSSPQALDSIGWVEWEGIEKPFASADEEAEFQKWQRILEEEEKAVDQELEEEGHTDIIEEINDDIEVDHDLEVEPLNEDEEFELLDELEVEVEAQKGREEEEQKALEANEYDEDETDALEREEADEVEEVTFPAVRHKGHKHPKAPKGVVEGGVRTRMLNVGGEQVMEISGVDDEDEMDDDDESPDWDDDVDFTQSQRAEMERHDPDVEVGRGVGGVIFTRKEIQELSEKDLIESYTKGSGRGGQKVNKTSSCVHLLHLPTGTRVKCQFSRELQANRARARTIMRQRLEELLLGSESRSALKAVKERRKKDRNRRRRAKKLADAEDNFADDDVEDLPEEEEIAAVSATPAADKHPASSAAPRRPRK